MSGNKLTITFLFLVKITRGDENCLDDLTVSDSFGDDCSWYDNNLESCGDYDDSNFVASVACCICCVDDLTVSDTYGDDCTWYDNNPGSCGSYDHSDFIAS